MQTFSMRHALRCPNGGLIIAHHNKIRDEIIHPAKTYFYPNRVCYEPLIHSGCSISEEEVNNQGISHRTRGDVSTRGLWEIQTEAIIYVRF